MPIAKVIRWNLALIVVAGLYGMVTNEPYWRDNGHGPWCTIICSGLDLY